MINYDDWAEKLQKSKLELIKILKAHMELVEKVERLQKENKQLKERNILKLCEIDELKTKIEQYEKSLN